MCYQDYFRKSLSNHLSEFDNEIPQSQNANQNSCKSLSERTVAYLQCLLIDMDDLV